MGATTHRIHRICSGVYYVGAITGDEVKIVSRWHPEFHQDMWHVIRHGETLSAHSYLRCAKEAALREDAGQ